MEERRTSGRRCPIRFFNADKIKTPTLFMGGEKDFNVPIAGGEQMYQALKSLGVDTQLVIYPGPVPRPDDPELRARSPAAVPELVQQVPAADHDHHGEPSNEAANRPAAASRGDDVDVGRSRPADMRTRAEITNYEETSTYADVTRVIDGLVATSPLVHTESFGKTEEGRELPLVVISDPKVTTPAAARKLGRPMVFVQANIHAGEVEGKEAILKLARRLVSGDLKPMTRQMVFLIAPDYNADGNEKVTPMNRTAQNGPVAGVGTRENSKGFDLNRDYMKLDTAEARSLVGLMNKWDPHVLVDLHTTNGSYHGYHLTYSPILNPERRSAADRVHEEPDAGADSPGDVEGAQLADL